MSVADTHVVLSAVEVSASSVAAYIGAGRHRARVAAATAAGAHGFIAEFPEGYSTPLGPDGFPLNGAQALRLIISRMLVIDPPDLVVDDPTRGLDVDGEAAVLPGLEVLFRGRNVTILQSSPDVRAAAVRARGAGRVLDGIAGDPRRSPPGNARLPADPRLSQLARLLDPHEMAAVLGPAVSASRTPDVRVHSVRYKPGDNVVVQYAVTTELGWSTAVAYATTGDLSAKPHRPAHRTAALRAAKKSPADEPFGYLPEVSAVVQWLPLDVRLPLLSTSAKKLNRRLVAAGLEPVKHGKPQVLRYRPRRRAVVRFGPYVLKTYRDPQDYREAEQGLRAAAGLKRVTTPNFEAALPERRITVQQRVRGHSPSLRPAESEPAGALLAELHGESVTGLRVTTPGDILAKSANRAKLIGFLLPEVKGTLDALLSHLEDTMPDGSDAVTSHGNFHAGQLLANKEGLVLIDVDRLCLASPAFDLASFAAHVAFGREEEMDLVTTALDNLRLGYGSKPAGLAWALSNCLLWRAQVPFRWQDEHWPDATANLVGSARKALQ